MGKRLFVAFMWAGPTLLFYELGWSLFGFPRFVGPILAIAIGAFIVMDPAKLLWPQPSRRVVQPDEFQSTASGATPAQAPR